MADNVKETLSASEEVGIIPSSWMRRPMLQIWLICLCTSDMRYESLRELSCDDTLKTSFKKQSLLDFWIQQCGSTLRFRIRPCA